MDETTMPTGSRSRRDGETYIRRFKDRDAAMDHMRVTNRAIFRANPNASPLCVDRKSVV